MNAIFQPGNNRPISGDNDTPVGFDQSVGDRITLVGAHARAFAISHAVPVNGGHDTLITFNDDSTILLKGISRIAATFFASGLGAAGFV